MHKHITGKITLAALVASLLLAGCGQREAETGKEHKAPTGKTEKARGEPASRDTAEGLSMSAEEQQKSGIKVVRLAPQELAQRITATATIQANQDRLAHVAPRVAGRIVAVNASLGDRVKRGQLLASLDSIELGEARAAYLQAKSEADVAQAALDRATGLVQDNIVPQKEFLRTRAEAEKSRAALRTAAEKLRLLGVAADTAGSSTFPLSAPFAGTVIEKKAVLGELGEPNQSLFTVADLSVLWIETDLFEKDLALVKAGAPAEVSVAAYPGEMFKGRVTYIASVMNRETRTVRARVEVPNKDGRLKPEMFASVAILTGAADRVLRVPDQAVLLVQGQATVFVLEGKHFEPRPVEVAERVQGQAVIRSGLKAGEQVVTEGAYALKAKLLKSQIGDAD